MRLPIDPRLELSLDATRRPVNLPGKLGELPAAREDAEASVSTADDRNYFRTRAEEHGRMAAEAKNPAARAAHLELAERYYERSIEADVGAWVNEGGSWQ